MIWVRRNSSSALGLRRALVCTHKEGRLRTKGRRFVLAPPQTSRSRSPRPPPPPPPHLLEQAGLVGTASALGNEQEVVAVAGHRVQLRRKGPVNSYESVWALGSTGTVRGSTQHTAFSWIQGNTQHPVQSLCISHIDLSGQVSAGVLLLKHGQRCDLGVPERIPRQAVVRLGHNKSEYLGRECAAKQRALCCKVLHTTSVGGQKSAQVRKGSARGWMSRSSQSPPPPPQWQWPPALTSGWSPCRP